MHERTRLQTSVQRGISAAAAAALAFALAPIPPSAAGPAATATIGGIVALQNATAYLETSRRLVVVGEVTNASAAVNYAPFAVQVSLLGSAGAWGSGRGLSPVGATGGRSLSALAPGEAACYRAVISPNPSGWAWFDLAPVARAGAGVRLIPAGVRVEGDAWRAVSAGRYRILGTLVNGSPGTVAPRVVATLYGGDGKVLGCVAGVLGRASLRAGASTSVRVDFSGPTAGQVVSYRLRLEDTAPAPRPAPPPAPTPTPIGVWAPKFKAGTNNFASADTCTQVQQGGSCTYYWTDTSGASGLWLRVEPRAIAECAAAAGPSIEPGDALNNDKALTGPAGSLTVKFHGTGGYVIKFRVVKDGNNQAYYDEKPMKVQPCGGPPAPTPAPTPTLTPIPLPTPMP